MHVHLFLGLQYGAYIEYSVALAPMTFPIPESITFEEAATIPLAAMTAAIALFRGLSLPEAPTGQSLFTMPVV